MAIAFDLSKTTQSARPVRYKIHDHARVNAPDHPSGLLDIWIPVIPETPYQRVLDIEITAPGPWQMHRESEFGNLLFHCRTALSTPSAIETHFRYLVERLPLTHDLDPARVGPVSARQLFARVLAEERFVDVNDKTRALARDIVRGETNPLLQARQLYNHVTSTMAYDAAQQSWKGSTEHALVCSVGNCNDIHALFISLARSLGYRRGSSSGKHSSHLRLDRKPVSSAAIIAGQSFSHRGWAGFPSMPRARASMASTSCSALSRGHRQLVTSGQLNLRHRQ